MKYIGLKPSKRINIKNGNLECGLENLKYIKEVRKKRINKL